MESSPAGTVHLVDDDPSFLRSLVRLLRAEGIDAVAWDGPAAFLAGQAKVALPACAVLDLRMPGMDGLELQEKLASASVKFPVIFLSAHADVPTTVRAVKAGAVDFLLKPFVPDQFLSVVRAALGRSREMMRDGLQVAVLRTRYDALTHREKEVLDLVVRGKLNKVIATELGAAEKTIKVHRGRVMRKMGVDSVAELVQQAVLLGLLHPGAAPAGRS